MAIPQQEPVEERTEQERAEQTQTPAEEPSHRSPRMVLTDQHGAALCPTAVPPPVEFDDYAGGRLAEDRSAGVSLHAYRDGGEEAESYFDLRVSPSAADTDALGPRVTPDVPDVPDVPPSPMPPLNRASTAPGDVRRGVWRTRSALLTGMKRWATGAEPHEHQRAPDDAFSDSYSDWSSSEDEAAAEAEAEAEAERRRGRPPQRPRQTEYTDFAHPEPAKTRSQRRHSLSRFSLGNDEYKSQGRVSRHDGRLNISINEVANSGFFAKAFGRGLKHSLEGPDPRWKPKFKPDKPEEGIDVDDVATAPVRIPVSCPPLNIVIMVIGSRGDIQPFLKIGQILKSHGHRVRIASHPTFRTFVQDAVGLEFFSVGGDPSELMAFMVKNPGLIPNLRTIREGEIQRRRASMAVMFEGFWRACVNATDDERDRENLKMMGDRPPFVADAIIANPPSMAHVHIAEKLGVPLHIMFTFPYTPTQMFPHPLANIKRHKSNVDESYVNLMSYPLVEMMTWQGLGDIVNRFRENTLHLEPVSSLWAPRALYRMKVPYTYLWSPALCPKPRDWGPEIDIAGFVFLELASNFTPDQELVDFLNAGEPPVYIGFGSIVIDDPNAFTEMIFRAVDMAGVRAVVNKGWGGLGTTNQNTPDNIFMLGNTPHDWLFPRVQAVVHHGGCGTTAVGLKYAKPTMIVPFFGDQFFWGAIVAEAQAGAHACVPYKSLTVERLAEGIKQCLTKEARRNVQQIADSMAREGDGAVNAVDSFHQHLPLVGPHNMRCSILEDRVAVWKLRHSSLRLSPVVAEILYRKGRVRWSDLKLLRHVEWNDFDGPGEPITGTVGAVKDGLHDIGEGVGMVPVKIARHIRKYEEHTRKRAEAQRRREERRRMKAAKAASAAEARQMAQQSSRGQRPGVERIETNTTQGSVLSAEPLEPLPVQLRGDIREGLRKSGAALLTLPNDMHVAIAQGMHNAPRLWGDTTVRKPVRITGFKSGCKAAGREFAYDLWDGCTGLITQPVRDWRHAATAAGRLRGVGVGVGKGIGGLVWKTPTAIIAPPAYFAKGVIKYVEKRSEGPGVRGLVRKAHIIQGQRDFLALQRHDHADRGDELRRIEARVDEGWRVYQDIWCAMNQESAHTGANLVRRYQLYRDRRTWEENGALENIDTARRAHRLRQRGGDVDELMAQRRREIRQAERRHRASGTAKPPAFLPPDAPRRRRRGESNAVAPADIPAQTDGAREAPSEREPTARASTSTPTPHPTRDEAGEARPVPAKDDEDGRTSESTAVATPEAEEQHEGPSRHEAPSTADDVLHKADSDGLLEVPRVEHALTGIVSV